MDHLISERERLWNLHPIIGEAAILPSTSIQNAIGAIMNGSRKTRFSHAFWADPCTGKSSCLDAIEDTIKEDHPGSGVLFYEPMKEDGAAEGRLLEDMLLQMEIGAPIARTLAGKRDQLTRALLALAGADLQIFILIDEAQELHVQELNWLKGVINKVVKKRVKVTTVLMGQRQLLDRVEQLKRANRQDLLERFFKRVLEFTGCKKKEEFSELCEAIDSKSEYPEDSGWTYTQFLFPRAYAAGFRLQAQASVLWEALVTSRSAAEVERGVPMQDIAGYMAQVCILHKDLDAGEMQLSGKLIVKAIKEAFR